MASRAFNNWSAAQLEAFKGPPPGMTKEEKQIWKAGKFGLMYGVGPEKLNTMLEDAATKPKSKITVTGVNKVAEAFAAMSKSLSGMGMGSLSSVFSGYANGGVIPKPDGTVVLTDVEAGFYPDKLAALMAHEELEHQAMAQIIQIVPQHQVWVRLKKGAPFPGKNVLVKLLAEESEHPLEVNSKAIIALVDDGKWLMFNCPKGGTLLPQAFVGDYLETAMPGSQILDGSFPWTAATFAVGIGLAAKIAAELDAADAPDIMAAPGVTAWVRYDLGGLTGFWEKNYDYKTAHSSFTTICRAVKGETFWYELGKNGKEEVKKNRLKATQELRLVFCLELKPALRVYEALVAGRAIRLSKPLIKNMLWGYLMQRTTDTKWENLHKPMLSPAAGYIKPDPEAVSTLTPKQYALNRLNGLQLGNMTGSEEDAALIPYQLRELAAMAYTHGMYNTVDIICGAIEQAHDDACQATIQEGA